MRRHISYAIKRRNLMPARVQHLHKVFTRLKASGKEVRLIVDGSDAGHPNAFNARLPVPPPPPAMLRVPTVVAVVMSGGEFGVDDVRTAFATMAMCPRMSRALGVGLQPASGRPALIAAHLRIPQGGTWSAAACQGHTLTAAVPPADWPRRMQRPDVAVHRDEMPTVEAAEWFGVLRDTGIIVHVDDVITVGPVGTVDTRRQAMRHRSELRYRMKWKSFTPAGSSGEALGMHFDVDRAVWGVQESWGKGLEAQLPQWRHTLEDDVLWARGCLAWALQVLHLPMVVNTITTVEWPERMLRLARARVSYAEPGLPLRERLVAWPRSRPHHVQLSDACTTGWAGAWLDGGLGVAGAWYRCRNGALSPTPCCSASAVQITSGEMVLGEALGSVATYVASRAARASATHQDVLVLTDNSPWAGALASAGSVEEDLAALIVLVWLLATTQLATAHVKGEQNTLDAPSRGRGDPVLLAVPPHTQPRWSTIGVATKCGHTSGALWHAVQHALPCQWQALGASEVRRLSERGGCACL